MGWSLGAAVEVLPSQQDVRGGDGVGGVALGQPPRRNEVHADPGVGESAT